MLPRDLTLRALPHRVRRLVFAVVAPASVGQDRIRSVMAAVAADALAALPRELDALPAYGRLPASQPNIDAAAKAETTNVQVDYSKD